MMGKIGYLIRKEHFSAAHRLHSPRLSEAENQELYGKCNHPNGHGHNYEVEVIVRGEIDAQTGMIMNLVDLKSAMKNILDHQLDHKNLDKDVEFFQHQPSTAENIAVYIWQQLELTLPLAPSCSLFEVRVHETMNNTVFYRGESTESNQ